MSDHTAIVRHHTRLLAERVELLRLYHRAFIKDPSLDPNNPLLTMWTQIEAFDRVVAMTVRRLDGLNHEHARANKKATLGFFEKQLRRVRAAQRELERLSERVMFDGPRLRRVRLIREYSEHPEANKFLEKMHLPGELVELTQDALQLLFRSQVPAVLAAQECVRAALIATIGDELRQVYRRRDDEAAEEDGAGQPVADESHDVVASSPVFNRPSGRITAAALALRARFVKFLENYSAAGAWHSSAL